jgi:hypothetical protein
MSASNVFSDLSNVIVPNPITALAVYSQGILPVYLFIGDSKGGLYIYDMSFGTQKQFSVSGTTITKSITGLATSDQYLFVNSPGNCFQLPIYPFYPTTAYASISLTSVANCYTRDERNVSGIVTVPDGTSVFVPFGAQNLSKIFTSDAGSGAVIETAGIPIGNNPYIGAIALDYANSTIYMSDYRYARMYRYIYQDTNNVTLSNWYFSSPEGDQFRANAYSEYSGTLAYAVIDKFGAAGVLGLQLVLNDFFVIAERGSLSNTEAIAYDNYGGLYMSTMRADGSYTITVNTYVYNPRPKPSVPPPRQQKYDCGLFFPGSCKRAYQPFNPRERFGWGSPNRPYRTLTLEDVKISCPPTYVDVCPTYTISVGRQTPTQQPTQPVVAPPKQSSSAQSISRTRNSSTTRVQTLTLNSQVTFNGILNKTGNSSPSFDGNSRLYISSTNGYLYYSDNYTSPNTFSSILVGGTLNASPACSSTDRLVVVTSRPTGGSEGALTMINGSNSGILWQKTLDGAADMFTPAYIGSNVFLAYGSNVTCFSSTDGSTVWNARALTDGDTYSCSVNVQFGNVFVGTTKGSLYGYSQIDGSRLLYYPANTGPILGSPNIGIYNRIIFGSGSNLFAINLDRSQTSNDIIFTNVIGNITSQITLAIDTNQNTNAFFTTDANTAYSVQIDVNTETHVTNDLILSGSSPVLDASYMYVMNISGKLWRYQWNPLNFTVNSNYQLANDTAGYSPSIIINSSSQVVISQTSNVITLR